MKLLFVVWLALVFFSCNKKANEVQTDSSDVSVSIKPVVLKRNNNSETTFPFTVILNKSSSKEVKVDFKTVDSTATSNYFNQKSGTLTIPAGQQSGEIDIEVRGDSLRETEKIFKVQLSNPVNATIVGGGSATGTILCEGTYLPVNDSGYTAPSNYTGLSLVWSDEFNGSAVNTDNWNFETGGGGWGNNELENYTNSTKNAFITNGGYLVIEARKEDDGTYTSARMQTKGKREFTYGRMDIRAKLPKTKGLWPAIWMLGSNISSTPWPACGEIDIMELLGNQPNKVYGTMHWGQAGQGSIHIGDSYVLPSGDFSDKFHVFSIVWDSTKIEWYVDNVKYFTGNKSDVTGNYPFDKSFFFLLNVAIGGNWPGAPDASTVLPQRMIVDYVRVYQ
ncbi:MAG TPA: family 16 glycosylhydrolase [Hanamia sp.]|nr:family 16 glycosylhydrolase [Hanamia sp.]